MRASNLWVPFLVRTLISAASFGASLRARAEAEGRLKAFAFNQVKNYHCSVENFLEIQPLFQAQISLWKRLSYRYTARLTLLLHPIFAGLIGFQVRQHC